MMARALRVLAQVTLSGALSPDARAARFAEIANEGRDRLIASGQASPRYESFVDGRLNGDELKARSEIAYRFSYLGDVTQFALTTLQRLSPVLTGRFKNSFFVAVNDTVLDASLINFSNINEASQVVIYNEQPYSRRVDVQLDGNTPLKFSVPPGLFDSTVSAIRGRYGNIVSASRVTNVIPPNPWLRKTGQQIGRLVIYPALLIVRR